MVDNTANRLTAVDGIASTWDANGNLLSNGTHTYNGLGDRLGQIYLYSRGRISQQGEIPSSLVSWPELRTESVFNRLAHIEQRF